MSILAFVANAFVPIAHEFFAHANVLNGFAYVFFWGFYGFRSYILAFNPS